MQEPIEESTQLPGKPESASLAHPAPSSASAQSLGSYFSEALKAAFLLTPNARRLPHATPSFVVLACLITVVAEFAATYAMVAPNARFYPQAITAGWLGTAILLCACWMSLYERDASNTAAASSDGRTKNALRDVASLFTLAVLMGAIIYAIASAIYVPLYRLDAFSDEDWGTGLQWVMWGLGLAWVMIADIVLLARHAMRANYFVGAVMLLLVSSGIHLWAQPAVFWYPGYDEAESAENAPKWDLSHLQPARLLKQAGILDTTLAALPKQQPGKVDAYVITYSPYASEDVFLNEGEVVTRVMGERFGTSARTIRLVNHASTVETLPWATPENLKKTLDHVGTLIDPREDLVFIHLASHGGSDGKLSAEFWPLQIDTLTGATLRTMLDEANIAVRLLSISACYSGGWIEPLRTEGTMTMTASDADHTSYGCGRKSQLTFFTRAVFSEQLSNTTRSFEDALNAARPIIEAREKEAGKKDGFSNPQIFFGDVARLRVARWIGEVEAVNLPASATEKTPSNSK